jgi:hypothetical protein
MNGPLITICAVITNAVFATVGGLWLARDMARLCGGQAWKWLLAFWGIYMAECFAFSASMASNVWSFAIAVVWGFVFARWMRGTDANTTQTFRVLLRLAFYTTLPAVSFLSVFVVMVIGGWPVFTPEGGYKFGIPPFIPWPLCTVTGFFAAVVGSAVVGKVLLTVAIARRRMAGNGHTAPGTNR